MQQTFIMIKPDGVARGLVGEIIHRIERRNLKIVALKMLTADRELAMRHYAVHQGKDFFEPLVNFITSGPVVAMVVEGDQSIAIMRKMMGALEPLDADTGTIRGDFTVSKQQNIIHGSDSPESAAYEIGLWFPDICAT